MSKPRIIILYDYFLPAWKAGGPIRSIAQLIHHLYDQYDFYLICSACEYGENSPMDSILIDQWMDWDNKAKVYYAFKQSVTVSFLTNQFEYVKPDLVFINGLYSLKYNIKSLIAGFQYQRKHTNTNLILSPRGMLHPGALLQKRLKKKLFFIFFKLFNIQNKILWHATDEKEVHYIRSKFKSAKIKIASNFPRLLNQLLSPEKQKGELIMGTIALISPMKNHLEIIKALKFITTEVVWHIYGPVKDKAYWNACQNTISDLPKNIQVIYHGAIPPDQISTVLEKMQLFILPSKSENFGHAMLEALSAGKPVITTDTTPFLSLNEKVAGITVTGKNIANELPKAIHYFSELNQESFTAFQKGAISYAEGFVNLDKLKKQYVQLFSNI